MTTTSSRPGETSAPAVKKTGPVAFGQFMSGLYKSEFYWRIWSIFGLIMILAGLSWGILARNQKTLLSPVLLAGLGAIALFIVAFPLTRPHALFLLGGELLLIAMAFAGVAFGRKVPNAAQLISFGWFGSYFVALYLLGGGAFRKSFLYSIFALCIAGSVGWLCTKIKQPLLLKILGYVGLFSPSLAW